MSTSGQETPATGEPPLPAPRPHSARADLAALTGDGILFALNAGFANVVVFLSVFRQSVTHMTGRARNLSLALESFDWGLVGISVGLIIAFMAGSAISALFLPERDLAIGLPYGRVFLLEGVLLTVAATLLVSDVEAGIYVAALSFGLQNGKATFYYGAIIRTSHVTGIVTDIGVDLGLVLRRERVPSATVLIKIGVLVGFIVGGVLGAIAFGHYEVGALYFSAGLALSMTVLYWLLGRHRARAEVTG